MDTDILQHKGPSPGIVATVSTILFLAGLLTLVAGSPTLPPGPWASLLTIESFFAQRSTAIFVSSFLFLGAAISLAVFAATIISRLRFLGVRAAGADIGMFGGFAAAF